MINKDYVLVAPSLNHKDEVLKYVQETLKIEDKVSGDGGVSKFSNYEDWLIFENKMHFKDTTPANLVPGHTFFLTDNYEIIGMVNIRYELNEHLLIVGGHIGYSIRPKYRKQGFGIIQLKLALKKCVELGLNKVLLTCNKSNIGSRKIITSCGGVFENENIVNDNIVERYWIDIKGNIDGK